MAAELELSSEQLFNLARLVQNDAVALDMWNQVVAQILKSAVDIRSVEEDLESRRRKWDGIHRSLQIWYAGGSEKADLLGILESMNLGTFAVKVRNVFYPDSVVPRPTELQEGGAARKSEVDVNLNITEDHWVISMLRIPSARSGQHAFMMLEGIKDSRAKTWFIDFVGAHGDSGLLGNGDGKIRIDPFSCSMQEYFQREALVYARSRESDISMMNPKHGRETLARAWNVPSQKALGLLDRLEEARMRPPKFVITGDKSLLAYISPRPEGTHNCFTWAMTQLESLEEDTIRKAFEELREKSRSATMEYFFGTDARIVWYTSPFI